jgi:hypothetical protein
MEEHAFISRLRVLVLDLDKFIRRISSPAWIASHTQEHKTITPYVGLIDVTRTK